MPTLPNQTLLTVQEAADLLKVSAKTMRRWEAKGILIPIRTEGGHRRYSVAALQAYKKGHKKGRANKEKITTPAYAIFRQDVTEQPKINQGSALSQSAYIKPFDEPTPVKKSILEPSVKLEPLKKIKKTKSANSRNQQNTAILFASLVVASVIAFQKPLSQEISNITKGNKKPQLSFAGFQIQKILPNVSLSFFNSDNSGKLATNTTQKPKFSQVLAESISTNDVLFKVSVDGQFEGDLQVDGGNLTTRATEFNIINENATTINIGGQATDIGIGADTGTTSINNNLDVNGSDNDIAGTLNLSGNTLSSTADLVIDPGGGGVSIGTGTATDVDLAGDDLYVTGDFEVDGTAYIPNLAIGGDIFTDLTGTGLQVSSGVLETTLGTSITSSEIDDGTIVESDLNISNSGTNGYLLSYNSSTGGFTWITAATDSGFTDAGTLVTLTASTDNVSIGGSTDLGKLAVDGDTDEVQLLVQGNSTQTSNLITAEQSDGTDVFTVDNSGNLTLASGADLTIGSIGLNDVGSSNTTSGAYLIGVYDELTNSNATNLQDVLDDLDAAITGGATGDITAVGDILSGEAFTSGTPGSTLFFADNGYLGLGASAGRIEFDDQVTDEVNILGANVGIGTSTPGSKLEVSDGTDSLQIAASGDLTFVDADGAASITGPDGGALSVLSGSSQSLILGDAATGSNNGTVSIFSSDWEISSTGAITGVSFDANGTGNSITNIESADIADNTLTAADLAATLTFADGDLIDLSAINVSSATEGILVPQSTSCASGTANGQLCWDNDTFALYVGNGTSATLVGGTGGGDITSVTAGTGLSGGGSSGDVTLDFDSTELGNLTWGSGSGFTWTFDASAGTDTTLAFGNNSITATTGTLNLTGTLDLGTNTISDGNFNGNWGFNSGTLTGINSLTATTITDGTATLTGGALNGVTSADATTENTVEGLIFDSDAETISGVWTVADSTNFRIGTGGDLTFAHDGSNTTVTSTTGDLTFDNTNVTGSTIFDLGTDTSATDFLIRNNSGTQLLSLNGAGTLQLGSNGQDGQLVLYNELGATDYTTTFNLSGSQGADITYTLPPDDGTDNYVLTTNGSGVLAWEAIGGGGGLGGDITAVNTSTLTGLTGGATSGDVTLAFDYTTALSGDVALAANAGIFGASGFVFEGSTADTIETFITITDPTSTDKTITFPNDSGTVCLTSGNCAGVGGTGDVVGPGSSTDNALVRWNGTGGTSIQNSGIIIDDSNNITGVASLTATTLTDGTASLSSGTLDLGTNTISDGNFNGNWAFNSGNATGIGNLAATGTIDLGDAAADTISLTGSLDTGINFLDADSSSYSIAGADASTATGSAGNLTVRAGAGGGTSGNGGNLVLSGGTVTSGTAGYISLETGGSERLRVAADGTFLFEKGSNDLGLAVTAPTGGSWTLTIPALTADADLCTTLGNCAGVGGGVTESGTQADTQIAYFTSDGVLDSSSTFTFDVDGTTGNILGLSNSTVTTGNLASLTSTSLTTGNALDLTATYVDATGGTDSAIDINLTNNPSVSANTLRGIDIALTDAGALANTVYGLYVNAATANANDTEYAAYLGNGTDALQVSSVGDLTFVDADGAATITGPAGGALSVLSGASQSLILGDAATGSNNGTVSIFSSDWEISSTGAITGVSFDANGSGNSITNIESADIADDTIVNADINSAAAIAYSKLNLSNSIVTGDITDNTLTASDLAATLTFSDSDLVNLSAINVSSTSEGLIVPQATSCSSGTANGQLCWDNDTFALYIGNGSSAALVGGTGTGDITAVTAGTGLSGGGSSGDVNLDFDSTELGNLTWGSGSGFTWTFNAGATDPTIAFASDQITYTAASNIFSGDITVSGGDITGVAGTSIDLGEAAADTINFTVASASELQLNATTLFPTSAEGLSIGSTGNEYEALYLGDNNGAFFGLDQDWSLGYDEATDDRLELVTSGTSGLLVSSATVAGTGFLNTFDSLTTGTGLSLSLDALTSGTGVLIESAGSNTITGDLFRINIGSSVTATGDLFTVEDNGSQLFGLNDTQITSALPHQFTAAGDVAIAYDIQLTNQTASYIKSNGPLYLEAGESFENNNLTFKTYGTGDFIFDNDGSTVASISDTGVITGTFPATGTYTKALCWDNSGASDIQDCVGSVSADYAEIYPTKSDVDYAEIVSLSSTQTIVDFIQTDNQGNSLPAVKRSLNILEKATAANSKVLGVTSRNWGDFSSTGHNNVSPQDNPKPIALSGRVPVKVANTSAPINPGDMIGASSVAGQAQKSSGGYVVGQALESWQPNSGKDTVLVFVNPNYYLGSLADNGNLSQQFDQIATTSSSTNETLNLLANTVATHENDLVQLRDLPSQVASVSAELDLVKETLRTAQESGSSLYDVNQDSRISEIENRMLEQDSLFSVDSEGYQLLSIDRANFTDLTVLGDTILGDTVINGKLNVGTIQIDNIDNSIDAIGTLKIQPLALGSIEFMGGLITFDAEGNAKVNEITANKYKVAGASAGTAVLPPNQASIFISSTSVTSDSLIFVTAKKAITIPLAVTFKSAGTGFTVGLTNSQSQEIEFDWWIVDKVNQ